MSKKPFLNKLTKTILMIVTVCLITITLTGCDSSNRKPTADIDLDSVYASVPGHSVTVGEVYNKLRYSAIDYIENSVYNFLFAEEIKTVKEDLASNEPKYAERLHEEILTDIYGTSDEEEIDELTEKTLNTKIQTYIDKMYNKGYVITKTQILNEEFKSVESNYYLEVAEYVAAYNKLREEFEFEDGKILDKHVTDESYFTESDYVNWYENNYQDHGDVTALLIRFINSAEVNEVLKKFGIKSSGSKWYQIELDENNPIWKTQNGYNEYYDDYKLNLATSGLEPVHEIGNGNVTILKIYAEIYNYIYTYRNPIDLGVETAAVADGEEHLKYYRQVEKIINDDFNTRLDNEKAEKDNTEEYNALVEKLVKYNEENEETIVLTHDKLESYSTSVADYFYNTLKTEVEAEKGKSYNQYLTSAASLGSYYYLLFKISQVEDPIFFNEIEDNDDDKYEFVNIELLNTIFEEMFEDELTDSYIHTIVDERIEDTKMKIFDSIVESQFMYTSTSELATSYEKTNESNNNLLAEVTYQGNTHSISVKDAYSYLEPLYGPQVAANLLFQKYIKTTDYYTSLESKYDEYVDTVKLMLYYFANDYYSSSGYPSTIGKYNFMMLYYGTANVDEVVKDFLMVSDATSAFYADYSVHGFEGDSFYNNLLGYSSQTVSDFYSLTVSGLTVYLDRDEDAIPDEELITDGEIKVQAEQLLKDAYDYVANSNDTYANSLNTLVNEYNSSSRIPNNNPVTPEVNWAQYRKLGLHIKVSSFGTFTDTTDTLDVEIQNRVKELYSQLVDEKLGFTSAYLDTTDNILTTHDNQLTFLLVTAGATTTSAKHEADEEETIYDVIKVVINNEQKVFENVDFESETITLDQVKIYVAEYLLLGDVYSMPTETVAALDAYILPLIEKYTSQASLLMIANNTIGGLNTITFAETNELSASFNDAFKETYTRGNFLEGYIKTLQNSQDSYNTTNDWWSAMYNVKGGNN